MSILRSLVFGAVLVALLFAGTTARADDYRPGDAGGLACAAFHCDDASTLLWTLVPVAGPLKLTQGSDGGTLVDIMRADSVLQGASLGIALIGAERNVLMSIFP